MRKNFEADLKIMDNAYVLWGCKVGAVIFAEDSKIYVSYNLRAGVLG